MTTTPQTNNHTRTNKEENAWHSILALYPKPVRSFLLTFAVALLVASCGPSAVEEKPDEKALIGTYEARLEDGRISTLTISEGGAITGSMVPFERFDSEVIDYRAIQSTWELVDPSMTPSGSWCLEFEGLFLRVYTDGSDLILRHPYDVIHHKTAIYTPKQP